MLQYLYNMNLELTYKDLQILKTQHKKEYNVVNLSGLSGLSAISGLHCGYIAPTNLPSLDFSSATNSQYYVVMFH